jgi:hypothetical protein
MAQNTIITSIFSSIVLFAVVNTDYSFLYDVGCQGRMSDSGVFENTQLCKKIEEKSLDILSLTVLQVPYATELPYLILGDTPLPTGWHSTPELSTQL